MNIMFVENRQQARFWEAVAARLEQDGHKVCWMVQNAGFLSSVGDTHLIPYPNGRRTRSSVVFDAELRRILSADRNINYFGGESSHYGHYDAEISRILDQARPEVVFGESTLFHELMCIRHCRARGIPYLNPASSRYPRGRFSFYRHDTQEPFCGSGEAFDEPLAREIVHGIARRQIVPDYTNSSPHRAILRRTLQRLRDGLKITAAYFGGERYNTPSLGIKLMLEVGRRKNRVRWERLASRARTAGGQFRILYPLQMQPESNLDVWGNGYRDQAKLLAALLQAAGGEASIVIKPNPKSKYELSNDLLDLVASSDGFRPLPHRVGMGDALKEIDLIVTVTGTVAIEAAFAGIPVATLAQTINNTIPNCVYLRDVSGLQDVIRQIREGAFPRTRETQNVAFLNLLTRTSYKGIISNPYTTPTCIDDENVRNVHAAFRHVLTAVLEPAKVMLTP